MTNYEDFFNYDFVKQETLKNIPKDAVEIQITGGEPTIVPYFADLLKFLRQNYPRTKIKLQSNVRMLSIKTFFDKIKSCIDLIQTTFNSNKPEIFDELTRVKGSFQQVVNALKIIRETNLDIYFNILIFKQNYKHLKDTVKFLRTLFPDKHILLDYPIYLNEALKNKERIYVSLREIRPYVQESLIDDRVFVYNVTPCVFDEKFRTQVVKQGFIHDDRYVYPLPNCNSCVLKQNCNGYYRQNLLIFKNYSDFKVIK